MWEILDTIGPVAFGFPAGWFFMAWRRARQKCSDLQDALEMRRQLLGEDATTPGNHHFLPGDTLRLVDRAGSPITEMTFYNSCKVKIG